VSPETRLLLLRAGLWLACAGAAGLSCATRAPREEAAVPPPEAQEFQPATFVSALHHGMGDYPKLYAADSYGVWVGPDVAALKRQQALDAGEPVDAKLNAYAEDVSRDFLVFECHLFSAFADMSIGYEAVGLRGMTAYLLTPDGRTARPVQSLVGTALTEEQQGALKKFGRTNLLVFAKQDAGLDRAAAGAGAAAVRLVIEGYHTMFYFEWASSMPPSEPWQPTDMEYIQALKVGFRELYGKLAQFSHRFD